MDLCMENSDWKGYAARQRESKKHGKLRGRSVCFYIEFGGIFNDRMDMKFDPSGSLTDLRRHPFARPGPRHGVRAARARDARRAVRADPLRAGRHRAGRDGPRHLWRAQHGGRRQCAEVRRRPDDREGQEDRRRHDGSRRRRPRVQGRQLPRHRHRQDDQARRRRQGDLRADGADRRQVRHRPRRDRQLRPDAAEPSERRPCGRARGRSGDRRGPRRPLLRGRRSRPHHQSDDRARASRWAAWCRASARR